MEAGAEVSPDVVNSAETIRNPRKVKTFITDYSTDDLKMLPTERVSLYKMLHEEVGVQSVRWEARMSRLIKPDRTFDPKVAKTYEDSLRAMNKAGMEPSIVVLFTPEKWMIELAKTSPTEFAEMYRSYATEVREIYKRAGAKPKYVQVMNEINTGFQTKFSLDQVVEMIKITKGVFGEDSPDTKIMTTLLTDTTPSYVLSRLHLSKGNDEWKVIARDLVTKAGDSLDGVGFDYYPGIYHRLAFSVQRGLQDAYYSVVKPAENPEHPVLRVQNLKAYKSFGSTDPYEWIAGEKLNGSLKGKDIIIAETGAPGRVPDSKFQRFGYDRIIQSLSHLFSRYEAQGIAAHDLISAVGFFAGVDSHTVNTKFPLGVDFHPWTLVRKNSQGNWELTDAAKRLKGLIQSRLYAPEVVDIVEASKTKKTTG
jgi:hypothetical protein